MSTTVATVEPMEQHIAVLEQVRDLLATATELPEIKTIRDKAEAMRGFAKSARLGLVNQNYAAILRIEAERKLGRTLKAEMPHGGDRKSRSASLILKLKDAGIDRNLSVQCRRMATISESELSDFIDDFSLGNKEITTTAVLKLAKTAKAREVRPVTAGDTEGVTDSLESLTEKSFKTIYADPPWQYGNQATRASTDNHYDTMSVEAIAALPVKRLAADESILFLWTTNGFLRESFSVIDAWGFEFKSSMVWIKPQMGIGNYVRNSHELLLIANRGGMLPTDARKKQMSWVNASRGKHSAKPKEFRRIVETLGVPDRLELFGRSKAEGWVVFGNQIVNGLL